MTFVHTNVGVAKFVRTDIDGRDVRSYRRGRS